MTAALAHPATFADARVTQGRVLLSEWTKFRSLRSTVWTLLVAIVLTIGFAALFCAVTNAQWNKLDPGDRLSFNPVSTSLNGVAFSQLAIGVLGVLFMSGEYSTGMIRSSLTAVPRRFPVLWAKVGIFALVVGVLSIVTAFISFFLGQALLGTHHGSLGDSGALRMVVGSGLYVTVAGIVAIALGGLMRNTAAGISTFVAVFFVLPPVLTLLPDNWTRHFAQYLPAAAGQSLWSTNGHVDNPWSPWVGFLVLCVWAAVLLGFAALRLRRTDA